MVPIAERIRPRTFDEMVGQDHIKGRLKRMADSGRLTNMIFAGAPGTGKTTAANIIASSASMTFIHLNATTASLSDIREAAGQTAGIMGIGGILLYLDEIQYFNKKQQQSLLEYIEDGRIVLIAATTENPYYYIYDAILSRSTVYEFRPVPPEKIIPRLNAALELMRSDYGINIEVTESALRYISECCSGDVRRAVTLLESVYLTADSEITEETVRDSMPSDMPGLFDRNGDVHYNLLSGLQKSIRGSDPDAAVFYLAKLLEGGDIISVCRRLQVIASEDVGLAYPMAAVIVRSCCESAKELGLPEARIPLANAAVMLATAPKSNSAYTAVNLAAEDIKNGMGAEIPSYLKSPQFRGYKYPHEYKNHYVKQQYLPDDLKDRRYYVFGDNKTERAAKEYHDRIIAEAEK